jgi:tRNA pseudouridine13 synthase
MMLEYLAKYPDNYANAIRKLPRSISLMFIHSVEAYIFNRELEERIKQGQIKPREGELVCYEGNYGFPDLSSIGEYGENDTKNVFLLGNIIGHDTKKLTELEKNILDEKDLTLESFKVKGLNELNSKGTYRVLFAPFKNCVFESDEINNSIDMGFSLPSGSYATVLIDESIESNKYQ